MALKKINLNRVLKKMDLNHSLPQQFQSPYCRLKQKKKKVGTLKPTSSAEFLYLSFKKILITIFTLVLKGLGLVFCFKLWRCWSHSLQPTALSKDPVANPTLRQLQAASEIWNSGNIRKQLRAAVAAGSGSCWSTRPGLLRLRASGHWTCSTSKLQWGKTAADLISDDCDCVSSPHFQHELPNVVQRKGSSWVSAAT